MLKQTQKIIGDNDKFHGDCWITCIAIILKVDREIFPLWEKEESWDKYYDTIEQMVYDLGYTYVWYKPNEFMKLTDRGTNPIIVVGKSPRSTEKDSFNHAVVWTGNEIIDPHPDNTGVLDIQSFDRLIPNEEWYNTNKQ
jgi:hypothetical protein